ncbi:MAG: hypothetical protein RQ867_06015 [Mariprofundaceae bacterium]|nr:hypothetical protein [Mariprofundaceae bacterium]
MKYALLCAVFAAALFSGNAFAASSEIEELKIQLKQMQQRIEQLERREKRAGLPDNSRAAPVAVAEPTPAKPVKAETAVSGAAENQGNPAISVIGNFTGQRIRGSGGVRSSSFLPLSEAEFIFGANIDPHARLDVTVTGADGGMAVEEGYITGYLPYGFNVKAGRKFLPIGRVNAIHPHALIYADRPNGLVNLFGPEIFAGDGLLIDRPIFIGDSVQTLTAGLFSTQNDVAFDPTGASQYAALARWTGVWDTSDDATLELGGTYIQGKNGIVPSGSQTRLASSHLAWKQLYADHSGFNIEAEWIRRWQEHGAGSTLITDGSYLLADVALNRNWHLFSRFDYSRERDLATRLLTAEKAISAGLVWRVSEFQSLTLQHKHTRDALPGSAADLGIAVGERANAWYFRWVVAIGPHGAHAY